MPKMPKMTNMQLLLEEAVKQTVTKIQIVLDGRIPRVELNWIVKQFRQVVQEAGVSPIKAHRAGYAALRHFQSVCEDYEVPYDTIESIDYFFWTELSSWYNRAENMVPASFAR